MGDASFKGLLSSFFPPAQPSLHNKPPGWQRHGQPLIALTHRAVHTLASGPQPENSSHPDVRCVRIPSTHGPDVLRKRIFC